MPLRRKEVRALVMAAFERALRVEVQRVLASCTWAIEERERLEARRWGIRKSRGADEDWLMEAWRWVDEWEREVVEVEDIIITGLSQG